MWLAHSSGGAFSIDRFAEAFKKAIKDMLENEHGEKIKDDIRSFMEYKKELESNPDPPKVLRHLVKIIVTRAWYYKIPSNFDEKMNSFINKFGANFRTRQGKDELLKLVNDLAPPKIKDRARIKLEEILKYPSIRQFTEELYTLANQGKTIALGEKGRDNYLRDVGYFDRIPIDRHEMRFLIRTGIYHIYSVKDKRGRNDPLQKAPFHEALTRFCSRHLKGYTVFGIDLGNAPGIVDVFIWSLCSDKRYNICGSEPKCDGSKPKYEKCPLKDACLYAIVNISNKITKS